MSRIESEANERVSIVLAEARVRVSIPEQRRVRYRYVADAIAAQIAEPAIEKIEKEMREKSEALDAEFYTGTE